MKVPAVSGGLRKTPLNISVPGEATPYRGLGDNWQFNPNIVATDDAPTSLTQSCGAATVDEKVTLYYVIRVKTIRARRDLPHAEPEIRFSIRVLPHSLEPD